MLKLHMAKAYNRMNWGFIYSILEAFGFDQLMHWGEKVNYIFKEIYGGVCGNHSRGLALAHKVLRH